MTRAHVAWAWARQRCRRFPSRAALERHHARRARVILAHVRTRSPFYRDRLLGETLDDLRAMTPIDKAVMMANFDTLNTLGIRYDDAMHVALAAEGSRDFAPTLGGVTVGLSSGTSGSRGLFLASDEERAVWAGTILAKLLPGALPGVVRHRIAFFLRANSNLYEAIGSRRLQFVYFDLFDPVESQFARLRDLSPTVLVGPPSLLRQLAAAQDHGVLALRPDRVVSVAEVLDPLDEVLIRRAFGRTVHQVYQATEGLLGTTCPYGTMHLAEDLILFDREPIGDDPRRFVPIVTDLYRTTQPIIRYRLNDVLIERESPCLCGSVMTGLERIEGRSDDVFVVRTREGVSRTLYPDFVRRAVIASADGIRAYHVRQTDFNVLEVFVEADGNGAQVHASVRASIERLFESMEAPSPDVRFTARLDVPPGRKLRRIERAFHPAHQDMPAGFRP